MEIYLRSVNTALRHSLHLHNLLLNESQGYFPQEQHGVKYRLTHASSDNVGVQEGLGMKTTFRHVLTEHMYGSVGDMTLQLE